MIDSFFVTMNESIQNTWEVLLSYVTLYGLNVLGAVVTLIVGWLVAGWLARIVDRSVRHMHQVDSVFHGVPGKLVRIAILTITVIAVLNRFGVETASLIAILGAAGLAIGLALQGTLSNVASGVMIYAFRPFHEGDMVKIAGETVVVDKLGFFVCRGHMLDGPSAIIPNSEIWGKTIVNLTETFEDRRRIDEEYGIDYGDDINAALAILNRIASEESRILPEPAPLIKVVSLGDSSVNILFRVWTRRADWWATKLDLVQRCKEALEAGGCSIPFPQRDVHVIAPDTDEKSAA